MFGPSEGGYEFSARPRVVDSRPKFRDPYGSNYEYIPQNIMHDKRIARGSTNASMVIPAGNHPDAIFLEKKKEQQRRLKMKQEEDARRRAELEAQRDIKTPEPLPGRTNLEIQTEPFIENLTDKPTEFEIGVQSDFYIDRPPTPLFVPIKIGEDAETQVEKDMLEEDVYDFNEIVEPILSVMCYNTIEQAQMEVYEEHEFNTIDTRRNEFERVRNLKLIEAQRLEAAENRRKKEMERRRNQVKARVINKVSAHQKYTSRQISKKYLSNVLEDTVKLLEDHGTLAESLPAFLHKQAVPWLYEQTMKFLNEEDLVEDNTEEMVEEALHHPARAHHETVEQDNERKRQIEREEEERLLAKEERRRKRQEAKEAARRAEEIKKFKADVNNEFIEGGEQRDRIIAQEFADQEGGNLNIPVVGVTGGHLTQILTVLLAAHKDLGEKISKIVDEEQLTRFLVTYISQHMKQDHFYVTASSEILNFCHENNIKVESLHKLKEEGKKNFKEKLFNTEDGMLNEEIRGLLAFCEESGLNQDIVKHLHNALIDIVTKSPLSKEGNLAKLDSTIDKIKLSFPQPQPEGEDSEEKKHRAVVRIRIPMEEVKDEEEEQEKPPTKKDKKEGKKSKQKEEPKPETPKEETKKEEDAKEGEGEKETKEEEEKKEPEMREAEIEDRVLMVNPHGEDYNIYVSHQAASRILRKDIISCLVKNVPEFEEIDSEDLEAKAEEINNTLEQKWIERVQANSEEEIHVFDFDIN